MTGASSSAGAAPAWSTIASGDLPLATTSAVGGIKVGTGLSVSSGTVSVAYGTSANTALQGNTTITNVAISANTTANNNYPIVFATSTTATTTAKNEGVQKSGAKLYFNPSTGNLVTTKINGLTPTASTTGFTIAGGTTSKTLTVSEDTTLQGGSANYVAYYNEANKIKGHGAARFADTFSSTTANGKNELVLGNNTTFSSNGSAYGRLALYSPSTAGTYLISATGTSWQTATLPAKTGLLVMLENGTAKGGANKPVYVANTGLVAESNTYAGGTSITLNGTSKASTTAAFYAPTASGTANYVLQSGGANNSPTWIATTNGALYATTANGAAQFGILPIAQGGTGAATVSKNLVFAGNATTDNSAPSFRALVANDIPSTLNSTTFTGKVTNNTFTHPLISGTGTAAVAKTTDVPGKPALWKFNLATATPAEGDIIHIKIPCAGHGNGVFVSTDNGTTYYPVSVTGTTRLTTHYANGDCISLIFLTSGGTNTVYPVAGGTATTNITGGHWLVLNYYNYYTDTYLRVYTQTSGYNGDYPLLVGRTVASTLTAKTNGKTTDVYGVIYKTNAPTLNPSTGLMKVPGGIEINVSSFTSASSATASTAAYSDLNIGNNVNVATASAHSEGRIYLFSANTGAHILRATSTASDITHYFPNSTGWVATGGNGTDSGVGDSTTPVYLSTSGILTTCSASSSSTANSIVVRDANQAFSAESITSTTFASTHIGMYSNGEGGNLWLYPSDGAHHLEIDAYNGTFLRLYKIDRNASDGTLDDTTYDDLRINLTNMGIYTHALCIGSDISDFTTFDTDTYKFVLLGDNAYFGQHLVIGNWGSACGGTLKFLPGVGYPQYNDESSCHYYMQSSSGYLRVFQDRGTSTDKEIFMFSGNSIAPTKVYTNFEVSGSHFEVTPPSGSWNEGIRVHTAPSGYNTIALCGSENVGYSGTSTNTWAWTTNGGNMSITRNGTGIDNTGTAWLKCVSNVWYFKGDLCANHTNINGTKRELQIRTGRTGASHTTNSSHTFSPAFSNACIQVVACCGQQGFDAVSTLSVGSISRTGFQTWNRNAASASMWVNWIAVGY